MAGILSKLLKTMSGNHGMTISEQLLFDKVIGFKGIVGGVGVSTIIANTAMALSDKTSYNIGILDTNFLKSALYPLLFNGDDLLLLDKKAKKDILDFNGDISEISISTNIKNVYLVALNNRTIVDMLSTKDSNTVIEKVITSMKNYYDIILVDLSQETTQIATYSAIKCNKIYYVAEPSVRCTYNLRKTINTMATLAVPFGKANKVIINKEIYSMNTGITDVLEKAGLEIIGSIPLSEDIARYGASGRKIWGRATKSNAISDFHILIEDLIDDILQLTPINEKYLKDNTSNNVQDGYEDTNFVEEEAVENGYMENATIGEIIESDYLDLSGEEDIDI